MTTTTQATTFKITFVPTLERAAEAVVRAGGKGTSDEIREHTDAARSKHRVAATRVGIFIADMWANGMRVESFESL